MNILGISITGQEFNTTISTLGFVVLVWYAIDTNRIANQTAAANLRPIILRNGYLESWDIKPIETRSPKFIEFINHRNIAHDISGFLVLNNKKYPLLFWNETTVEEKDEGFAKLSVLKKWGWLPPGAAVKALYSTEKWVETTMSNQIYLEYKDTVGNPYYTLENSEFTQTSNRSKASSLTLVVYFLNKIYNLLPKYYRKLFV